MKPNNKYLYVDKLIYPNKLKDHNLPTKELHKYAFICSFIKVKEDKRYKNANVHCKVWENRLGSYYRKFINDLIEWDIITVQESYLNGKEKSFTKCYALTLSSVKSGFTVTDFSIRKPSTLSMEENIIRNNINIYDNVIEYTYSSINNIYISYIPSTIICADESIEKVIEGEFYLKKIATNNYFIKYGENCGRLYHPVICCPKVLRKTLWYKDSNIVMLYDIKSCFPVLLHRYVHPTEKDKYSKVLDGDIYNDIEPDGHLNPEIRNNCKILFQMFINGFVDNIVYRYFINEFPLTFRYIESNYKKMAHDLQKTESHIMVQGMIPFVIDNNIKDIILLHDGWMSSGNLENDRRIIGWVKDSIEKVCGYVPRIGVEKRERMMDI